MNRNKLCSYIFVLSISLFLGSGSSLFAQSESKRLDLKVALQKSLDNFVKTEGIPGGTLAVAFENGSVIAVGSGVKELGKQDPMSATAVMMLGSTGKTFVSAIALQLVAEGKIELDAKVASYFPSEENNDWFYKLPGAKEITVRQLMNHTSGIPRYVFSRKFIKGLKEEPQKSRSPKENLALLHGRKSVHPPGKGWAYSDSNYLVLGLVIEKVSGQSFYDLCQKRILTPLQLKATLPTTSASLPTLSQGHIGKANPFGLPKKVVSDGKYCINPDFEWCGGGFVTNTTDLATWVQKLHTNRSILKKDQYKQLVTPSDPPARLGGAGYGLGTFVWKTDQGMFYGHAGMMPGYLTQIEHSVKGKFTIALQVNSDEGFGRSHHAFVQKLAKELLRQ